MITYCTRCVMPATKPDLKLDNEGVCNACRSFENRKEIDWSARAEALKTILSKYKSQAGNHWDCVVPVSGGKDSTYQLLKVLEFGMTPLAVVSTTCYLSEIGRRNIDNLKRLGVDIIEFSPDQKTRKKLNRIGLLHVGDISWPEHVGIFTIPVSTAVRYKVPLIIWGENSQHEYGGPAAAAENNTLDRRWLEEFGGLLGLRVSDLCEFDDSISAKDLIPYQYPSDEDLKSVGVTGLFLGHYLPWDGYSNALISQAYGFEAFPKAVEGSTVSYENLDTYYHGIHDYFKFLKFAYGRATDQAVLHVRRGRLSRNDALAIVKMQDGKFPWTYLGKPLSEILANFDTTLEEFEAVCNQFTNKRLFKQDSQGHLIRDKTHSLIKINDDNLTKDSFERQHKAVAEPI